MALSIKIVFFCMHLNEENCKPSCSNWGGHGFVQITKALISKKYISSLYDFTS